MSKKSYDLHKNDSAFKAKNRARAKAWQDANPDVAKQSHHDWYMRNRDSVLKRVHDYRQEHLEEIRAYDRERAKTPERQAQKKAENKRNAEYYLQRALEWAEKNPVRVAQNRASYYAEHREEAISAMQQWRRDNPEKASAMAKKDREKRSKQGRITPIQKVEILLENVQHYKILTCEYCLKPVPNSEKKKGSFHIDHIENEGSSVKENLCIACGSCNASKNDIDLFKWLKGKGWNWKDRRVAVSLKKRRHNGLSK